MAAAERFMCSLHGGGDRRRQSAGGKGPGWMSIRNPRAVCSQLECVARIEREPPAGVSRMLGRRVPCFGGLRNSPPLRTANPKRK